MIIVSQDKDFIVNFDNVETIGVDYCNGMYDVQCTYNDGNSRIGSYKNEKRAKDVLNDIFVRKAMFDFYKTVMTDEVQNEICKDMKKDNILFNVFEMPKE